MIAVEKYKQTERKLFDDQVQDIYKEMHEELLDNYQEENFEGPIIDLEAKLNVYCKKRKILKKNRELILIKLNDLIDKETSDLKKHFIYMDGKVLSYVKLKNLHIQNQN